MARKAGPLPLWAWSALLLAVVAYWLWRARRNATGAIDPASLTDTQGATPLPTDGGSGSGSDPLPPLEPVTLGPGEGVYDPNTGHLITNPDPYAPQPTTAPAPGPAPVASPVIPGGGGPAWTLPRFNLPPGSSNRLRDIIAPIANRGGGAAAIPLLIGAAVPTVSAVNRTPSPPPASTPRPTFDWGGRAWGRGDRDSFTSWLRSHGSNYATWAKNHPGAAAML